jgi:hypothetical protein
VRRKQNIEESVDSSERLTDYTVTRAPSQFTGTGLPAVAPPPPREAPSPAVPVERPIPARRDTALLHVAEDRRDDVRCAIALPVRSDHPGREATMDGVTVDISASGLCVHMPEPPAGQHEDMLVTDGFGTAAVWGHIVRHRPAPEGGWTWHVKLLAADDNWDALVDRARDRNAGILDVRPEPLDAIA